MRDFCSANLPQRQRAFSLVEVALAIAVLAVALVGLLALIPSGVGNFQRAMDTTVSAQIAQAILADAQQTEFAALVDLPNLPADPDGTSYCPERFSFRAPSVTAPAWRYFDEEGLEIHPMTGGGKLSENERRRLVYQVNTRIRPRAELPTVNESSSQIAQITVQVVRNPGAMELAVLRDSDSPEHNLIKNEGKLAIFTYSAHVGRNHGR